MNTTTYENMEYIVIVCNIFVGFISLLFQTKKLINNYSNYQIKRDNIKIINIYKDINISYNNLKVMHKICNERLEYIREIMYI